MITIKEVETTAGIIQVPHCDCEQMKTSTTGFCEHIIKWFSEHRNEIPMKIMKNLFEGETNEK